jgi:nitrous oxidase accessory protein NosD
MSGLQSTAHRSSLGVGGIIVALALAAPLAPGAAAASATPMAGCGGSLQGLIDAAPAGSTLVVPACTYRESVTIDKPLTVDGAGAVIDGRDTTGEVVRATWMVIAASDVTVSGFTMRYADNPPQTGALRFASGANHGTIRDCDLGFAAGADVGLDGTDDSVIEDCAIHDGGQLGVHAGGGDGYGRSNVVRDDRIYHNNTAGYDPEWEAGGLKATVQTGMVLAGNTVYDNHGPGLWCDIYCQDLTVQDNHVYGNTHAGIMVEVSTGAEITGNAVWDNGWGKDIWGWGAGILLSSSGGDHVADNVVAWNASGISVISQDRQDWKHSATHDVVQDNVIVGEPGQYLLFWGQDWQGELYLPASADRGEGDRYWVDRPENGQARFAWDGDRATLAAFQTTPGESGASYLSEADKDKVLAAAGVPAAPDDSGHPLFRLPGRQQVLALLPGAAVATVVLLVALSAVVLWRRRRRRSIALPGGPG